MFVSIQLSHERGTQPYPDAQQHVGAPHKGHAVEPAAYRGPEHEHARDERDERGVV